MRRVTDCLKYMALISLDSHRLCTLDSGGNVWSCTLLDKSIQSDLYSLLLSWTESLAKALGPMLLLCRHKFAQILDLWPSLGSKKRNEQPDSKRQVCKWIGGNIQGQIWKAKTKWCAERKYWWQHKNQNHISHFHKKNCFQDFLNLRDFTGRKNCHPGFISEAEPIR